MEGEDSPSVIVGDVEEKVAPRPQLTPKEKAEAAKERDEAHASANKDQEEYDKQLLTLSVGVLGLMLAFIKDLIKVQSATDWWMFPIACCLLFSSIFAVLFSYQYSIYVNRSISLHFAYKMENREQEKPYPNTRARLIGTINFASGGLFFLGFLLTCIFVLTNLSQERHVAKSLNINEGQFIKSVPDQETR